MEALRLLDFVTAAIKRSGRWMLVLDFWPTQDEEADWSWLSWTLPWLSGLGGTVCVCTQLRRHGLALVACADEEEARRLLDQIRGFKVGARVFTNTGAETNWALPGNRPDAKGKEKRTRKRSPRPKKVEKGRLLHGTFHGSSTEDLRGQK